MLHLLAVRGLMSVLFRCDRCAKAVVGKFDGFCWSPPGVWFSRELTDWEIHACSKKCLNYLLENHQSSPQGFPIKEFMREIGPNDSVSGPEDETDD